LLKGSFLEAGTLLFPFKGNLKLELIGSLDTAYSKKFPKFVSGKVIQCELCRMSIHGIPKMSWGKAKSSMIIKGNHMTFETPLKGWVVKDKIVITTSNFNPDQSELTQVAILSSDGFELWIRDPSQYVHSASRIMYG